MKSTILSDRQVADYFKPSKCALRIYLRRRGEQGGEADAYEALLDARTAQHLSKYRASLSGVVNLSQGPTADRAERTQEAMARRDKVLFRPLLRVEAQPNKNVCLFYGEPDFLLWDEATATYTVRLCDSSHVVNEKLLPAQYMRASFYAYILEAMGYPTPCLEIVNGLGVVVPVQAIERQRLLDALRTQENTMRKNYEPYSPVGRTRCNRCPYKQRCWDKATSKQDIAIVRGFDQSLVYTLRDMDVRTIPQLLERFGDNEAALAAMERGVGDDRKPVGEKDAASIIRMARALTSGRPIVFNTPALPAAKNFAMFDLEGVPEKLDADGRIYLWGLQVFGEMPSTYIPGVAPFEEDGDRKGWADFLARCQEIFTTYGDIPFVHWDKYEPERLEAYIGRYGDPDGIAARVKANLLDLILVLQESVALPVTSYSLKVVEQYVQYTRTQEEYGTNWSISIFMQALAETNAGKRAALMDKLFVYNREDLEGTWAVLSWLKTLQA